MPDEQRKFLLLSRIRLFLMRTIGQSCHYLLRLRGIRCKSDYNCNSALDHFIGKSWEYWVYKKANVVSN